MAQILIVDDVPAMTEQYAYDLRRLGGHQTLIAGSGEQALELVRREPIDCIVLDLEMPGMDGFDVLRELRKSGIAIPVIVYTGTGNYERCVRAVKLGAYSFIDKSEPMERVVREIENALERHRLIGEVGALKQRLGDDSPLLGDSRAMRELKGAIARLAAVPSAVLITGESGSGKELVARELHRLSPRAAGPFTPVNCAALPENLVESELFGHEAGAFTGATRLRKGAFEAAAGGTLFLDEIGELPLPAQAKLLRVLEDLKISRLGGTRELPVDVRVVAASNRDLDVEIAAGRFREDLYYRLNVHVVRVPPVRERVGDVPLLLEHFLRETARRFGVRPKVASPEAVARLCAYDWRRNNVRELRNVVERMVIACEGDTIGAEHVPPTCAAPDASRELATPAASRAPAAPAAPGGSRAPATPGALGGSRVPTAPGDGCAADQETAGTLRDRKDAAEREIVLAALGRNDWAITRTAAELGLADHSSLLKIMRRLGITRPR
jgi:two-component system nitrogen regulation response regulator NtrX